jgi:hypothetical protein
MHSLAGLFLLGISACASTALATRADALEQLVQTATRRGALHCAPQELALAKVNLEFARLELSQGDRRRADHHLTLAEPNAKAALRVASDSKCHGSSSLRPPQVAGANDAAP